MERRFGGVKRLMVNYDYKGVGRSREIEEEKMRSVDSHGVRGPAGASLSDSSDASGDAGGVLSMLAGIA